MSKLEILTIPNPILKTVSEPVEKVDDEMRKLMDDMLETMYAAPGIGLAAIQVGVPKRILVIDVDGEADDPKPKFIINPEILWASEELNTYNEGCLSIPEQYAEIDRPKDIKIKYLDYNGDEIIEEMTGLYATCIQHEIDHLEGIVFIDHLSRLKRNMIVKKVQKFTKPLKAS